MRAFEFLTEAPIATQPAALGKDQLKKIDRINRAMQSDPVLIDELFKTLSLRVKDDTGAIADRILQFLNPDAPKDKDLTYANTFLKSFATVIEQTEGTTEEQLEFANTLGKVNHIDTKALITAGVSDWDSWLVGSAFSKRLFLNCFNNPAFTIANKGPGEAALAFLSPKISLQSAGGDIAVDGIPIEVKGGETKSGGRLSPTANAVGSLFGNKEFWNSLFPNNQATALALSQKTGINANNYSEFLSENNLGPQSAKILGAIFLDKGAQSLIAAAGKKGESVTALDIIKIAIKNYGSSQGDDNFLILQKDVRKSMFFNVDNVDAIYGQLSVSCPLIDRDARSAGKPQIGILKRDRK
jgi:hypothetical protein